MAVSEIPRRASRDRPLPDTEDIQPKPKRRTTAFIIGMLIMLGLYLAGVQVVGLWKNFQEQLRHGEAKISRTTLDLSSKSFSQRKTPYKQTQVFGLS